MSLQNCATAVFLLASVIEYMQISAVEFAPLMLALYAFRLVLTLVGKS